MAIPEFDLNHSDLRARGTHPCKGRKDGAPSIVVIPAKPKGGPPANGITEMGDCGRGNGMSGWLRSSIAGKLFLYSSWAVVSMGIFMLFMLTPWFQQMQAVAGGPAFDLVDKDQQSGCPVLALFARAGTMLRRA